MTAGNFVAHEEFGADHRIAAEQMQFTPATIDRSFAEARLHEQQAQHNAAGRQR